MGPNEQPVEGARGRWNAERTTFQRVYDYLVGTQEFTPVASFAEGANCSETGARSALEQLVEMGIAERREARPTAYRRNDSYFRWRRIERLAREHTPEELRESVEELLQVDDRFRQRYGVPGPDAISPALFATDDHDEIHDRWDDLTEWRTVRRDVELLQRAVHRAERVAGRDGASA